MEKKFKKGDIVIPADVENFEDHLTDHLDSVGCVCDVNWDQEDNCFQYTIRWDKYLKETDRRMIICYEDQEGS